MSVSVGTVLSALIDVERPRLWWEALAPGLESWSV